MKKLVLAVPVLALALGGTTACATKKFVRGQVGEVNDKVESVSKSLEETQERTKANEAEDHRSRSARAGGGPGRGLEGGQRRSAGRYGQDHG